MFNYAAQAEFPSISLLTNHNNDNNESLSKPPIKPLGVGKHPHRG
jgi:hypothetical protein